MYVQFYNFAKDNASTGQPTGTGAQFDCQLKNNTSIIRPSILLSPLANDGDITTYNYCYIPKFNRYYFIVDWAWIGGAWDISLSVDVLASFKTQIGNLSCYVERSADEFDTNVVDGFYITKAAKTYRTVDLYTGSPFYQKSLDDGCFCVGVINNNSGAQVGAVTYYALTKTQMYNFLHFMFYDLIQNEIDDGLFEFSASMYKMMFNPMQYIVSCMWFPKSATQFSGTNTTSNITFGYWQSSVQGYLMSNPDVVWFTKNYYIPKHPDTDTRGNYLNLAPYTQMILYYPPFGSMPLDSTFLLDVGQYIHVYIIVDQMTGVGTLRVYSAESVDDITETGLLLETTGQVGVSIPVAQLAEDWYSTGMDPKSLFMKGGMDWGLGTVFGAAADIGSRLIKKLGIPIKTGQLSGVMEGAISTSTPKVTSNGTQGALLYTYTKPLLQIEYAHLVDENRALYGRPLMKTKKLNTLPGFIKCSTAEVNIACTQQEREMIEAFLVRGFYWE